METKASGRVAIVLPGGKYPYGVDPYYHLLIIFVFFCAEAIASISPRVSRWLSVIYVTMNLIVRCTRDLNRVMCPSITFSRVEESYLCLIGISSHFSTTVVHVASLTEGLDLR
ncbi:hypothetical protein BDV26DRAFT_178290 [Aspergillus bertholletiae]|uniref:Uncharacterized protein n=1 Tax=Aspergillus bertholletiae TaxID=1226010 RepID=A0A5N7BAZ6_9EURO|nr:hypothetical protein BDV26DRAFT_178290 [Aspergillus bertholletiae]